jgi:hypothetical protein
MNIEYEYSTNKEGVQIDLTCQESSGVSAAYCLIRREAQAVNLRTSPMTML